MISKSESPGSIQSISQETADPVPQPDPALEGGSSSAVAIPRKSLSRIAQSIIRRLLSFYAFRRPLSILILVAIDALALFAGFGLSTYLMGSDRWAEKVLHLAPILLTVWLTIFTVHRLYDRASNRRSPVGLLSAVLLSSGLLAVGGVLYPELSWVPKEILLGALFALPLEGGMRLLYERGTQVLYGKKLGLLPSLLIGNEEERQWVRRAVERVPSGWAYVGEIESDGEGVDLHTLRRELDRTGARRVLVAGAERLSEKEFVRFMRSCRLRRVEVCVVPSAATLMGGEIFVSQETGIPLLRLGYPALDGPQRMLKRVADVVGALGGLAVLSPILLSVAILVKLTSPGSILFRQNRVGTDEKVFSFYKFRSMYEDAGRRQEELEQQNEADGVVFKMRDDPRVTPVGRFLRRWSIDELPQLVNVLKGEMSLVGPRPLPVRDFQLMEEVHKRRLGAVPGMTGYWQISGRSDLSFEEMVRLDLYYIENWSLSFDLKIILRTLGAVLRHEGAY
jgi:exopolysaccharide biosynthesis polyprenyl glycosylphosphotransferase